MIGKCILASYVALSPPQSSGCRTPTSLTLNSPLYSLQAGIQHKGHVHASRHVYGLTQGNHARAGALVPGEAGWRPRRRCAGPAAAPRSAGGCGGRVAAVRVQHRRDEGAHVLRPGLAHSTSCALFCRPPSCISALVPLQSTTLSRSVAVVIAADCHLGVAQNISRDKQATHSCAGPSDRGGVQHALVHGRPTHRQRAH